MMRSPPFYAIGLAAASCLSEGCGWPLCNWYDISKHTKAHFQKWDEAVHLDFSASISDTAERTSCNVTNSSKDVPGKHQLELQKHPLKIRNLWILLQQHFYNLTFSYLFCILWLQQTRWVTAESPAVALGFAIKGVVLWYVLAASTRGGPLTPVM